MEFSMAIVDMAKREGRVKPSKKKNAQRQIKISRIVP